ncbi:MAG: argininosuccinate lyase, partial [Candidatus Bathyarchaeota archaeon]|nr:argininosuccinate lyase [Candidatus Bathyarchaeota archaeon]
DSVARDTGMEDIHVAIETAVIKAIGEEIGGRMHTGRSRNDEVATCIRIALRKNILMVASSLMDLMKVILSIADANVYSLSPGYTHTQHAQPVTLAHHLIAYFDVFFRDLERLISTYRRVNMSPLGAAALAGSGFPLDRVRTAELLGFDGLVENSMDAVASRDFAIETLADLAIIVCNLSRLAEEIILWSTSEFGYIDLDEGYASTSSIMPQKKNPDSVELVRSKTGRVYGNLLAALTIVKALPYSYNRDFQDLTPHIWDSIDAVDSSIRIISGALATAKFNLDRLRRSVYDFSTATELADTLVRVAKLPFRTAHTITAALIAEAISRGLDPSSVDSKLLDDVSIRVYGRPLGIPDEIVRSALDPIRVVEARCTIGGPSPMEVRRMISDRYRRISEAYKVLEGFKLRLEEAERKLREIVDSIISNV